VALLLGLPRTERHHTAVGGAAAAVDQLVDETRVSSTQISVYVERLISESHRTRFISPNLVERSGFSSNLVERARFSSNLVENLSSNLERRISLVVDSDVDQPVDDLSTRRALLHQARSRHGIHAIPHSVGRPIQDVVSGPWGPERVSRRHFGPARHILCPDAIHAQHLRSTCAFLRLGRPAAPQGLERVHHRQKIQQVARVGALGHSQFARLEGDQVEGARVVRLLQNGCREPLRGATRAEKRSTNLRK
jgi:hypothetical protein